MSHETPLSNIVFQKPDGSTGELDIHDAQALHDVEGSVDSSNLAEHSVHEDDIAPGAVTSDKIADGAVGRDQLDPEFVESWDSLSQQYALRQLVRRDFNLGVKNALTSGSSTMAISQHEFKKTPYVLGVMPYREQGVFITITDITTQTLTINYTMGSVQAIAAGSFVLAEPL